MKILVVFKEEMNYFLEEFKEKTNIQWAEINKFRKECQ